VRHDPGSARLEASDRWGWIGVGAVICVVAVSWLRFLNTPLGDNHFGRVGGRYALHVRNLFADGLIGSSWSANWKPYSSVPYAHHPPLLNMLDAAVSGLPGDDPYQVMLAPHLLALLAIPAGAALLRTFGIGWVPTIVSVGAMTATGYYWVHGPIMFDIGPILLLSAVVVRLSRDPEPERRWVALGGSAAVLASLGSWPGIVFAVVLTAWLFALRRDNRAWLVVALCTAAGTAVSMLFMLGVHGWRALADQAEVRAGDADFGVGEFLRRQWSYANDLLPVWYIALYPLALGAGFLDRRTRWYTSTSAVLATGWVLGLRQGAFIHDYWAYLLLIPGLVGFAALGDWLAGWFREHSANLGPLIAAGVALALVASFGAKAFGSYAREYRDRPADAGRLASAYRPGEIQSWAWHVGAEGARWLAYYWDRPLRVLDGEELSSTAPSSDIVFVDLEARPGWLPDEAVNRAIASTGVYAVFDVATLRSLHASGTAVG
jgi:hypothetical protein